MKSHTFEKIYPLVKSIRCDEDMHKLLAYIRKHKIYANSTWTADIIMKMSRQFSCVNSYWKHIDNLPYEDTRFLAKLCNQFCRHHNLI